MAFNESSDISQSWRYDAYIGCCHDRSDFAAAISLAKAIKKYKLPKGVLSKESAECFNDIAVQGQGEAAYGTISEAAKAILDNSQYLIIICSPRAQGSTYVHSLIDYFIACGRKNNIIPLLLEGEPASAFPPQLFEIKIVRRLNADGFIEEIHEFTEPLAADIRARSLNKSLKLLKHAKLKIISALIGCAYDDLERRHYKRAQRKLVSLIAAIGTASLLITVVFSYLALQAVSQASIFKKQTKMADDVVERIYVEMPEAFSDIPDAQPIIENLMLGNMETLLKYNRDKAKDIDASEILVSHEDEPYGAKLRKAVLLRQSGKQDEALELFMEIARDEDFEEMYWDAADWLCSSSKDYGASLYVSEISEDSAVEAVGIEAGDVITGINGKTFSSADEMTQYLRGLDDERVSVDYLHRNKDTSYTEKSKKVKLERGTLGISFLPI